MFKKKTPKEASNLFESIMKASVKGNPKSIKPMNGIQKEIIDAIKKDVFRDLSGNQKITISGISRYLANIHQEDIQKAILALDGVEIINSMTGEIEIPEKYFQ